MPASAKADARPAAAERRDPIAEAAARSAATLSKLKAKKQKAM